MIGWACLLAGGPEVVVSATARLPQLVMMAWEATEPSRGEQGRSGQVRSGGNMGLVSPTSSAAAPGFSGNRVGTWRDHDMEHGRAAGLTAAAAHVWK